MLRRTLFITRETLRNIAILRTTEQLLSSLTVTYLTHHTTAQQTSRTELVSNTSREGRIELCWTEVGAQGH
ncbi:hypothetical protein JOB18_010077 [Solea senegalensis]|uniref:Uncharacterized protein n=1 Tax=Solea senegalensis TaxID=28829 RepID=A0AAV6SN75_SOLSE|nr:hypothetical protein JOB18_010077 [Solea senegalensis]